MPPLECTEHVLTPPAGLLCGPHRGTHGVQHRAVSRVDTRCTHAHDAPSREALDDKQQQGRRHECVPKQSVTTGAQQKCDSPPEAPEGRAAPPEARRHGMTSGSQPECGTHSSKSAARTPPASPGQRAAHQQAWMLHRPSSKGGLQGPAHSSCASDDASDPEPSVNYNVRCAA